LLFNAIAGTGPARTLLTMAFVVDTAVTGIGALGAAAMARLLSAPLTPLSRPTSKLGNHLRGALVCEVNRLFPVMRWFLMPVHRWGRFNRGGRPWCDPLGSNAPGSCSAAHQRRRPQP
jgi:hypothetical protein